MVCPFLSCLLHQELKPTDFSLSGTVISVPAAAGTVVGTLSIPPAADRSPGSTYLYVQPKVIACGPKRAAHVGVLPRHVTRPCNCLCRYTLASCVNAATEVDCSSDLEVVGDQLQVTGASLTACLIITNTCDHSHRARCQHTVCLCLTVSAPAVPTIAWAMQVPSRGPFSFTGPATLTLKIRVVRSDDVSYTVASLFKQFSIAVVRSQSGRF